MASIACPIWVRFIWAIDRVVKTRPDNRIMINRFILCLFLIEESPSLPRDIPAWALKNLNRVFRCLFMYYYIIYRDILSINCLEV